MSDTVISQFVMELLTEIVEKLEQHAERLKKLENGTLESPQPPSQETPVPVGSMPGDSDFPQRQHRRKR